MEIEGIIVRDLGEIGGISKAGNQWKKHEWVLETLGEYPRKVKFTVFGNKMDVLKFEMGKTYVIQVDVESREFNERWYTDVNAYAARLSEQQAGVQAQNAIGQTPQNPYAEPAAPAFGAQPASPAPSQNPFANTNVDFTDGDATEDLPF